MFLSSHGHSSCPGTSSFLIDGSNQTLGGNEPQFMSTNDNGTVFSVIEDGTINSVRNIRASTDVIF